MSMSQIKARLVTQILGVAGIGKAYDRMRLIVDRNIFQTDCVVNQRVNVWFVTRELKTVADLDVNQAVAEPKDLVLIHGFLSVKDSDDTDSMMDDLTDGVVAAINADRRPPSKLNNLVLASDPPQLRTQDLRHFGPDQVLCHHVEIALTLVQAMLQ
jgi:hypothetical protein